MGTARHAMIWDGHGPACHDMAWARHGMPSCGVGTARHAMIWHGHGPACLDTARHAVAVAAAILAAALSGGTYMKPSFHACVHVRACLHACMHLCVCIYACDMYAGMGRHACFPSSMPKPAQAEKLPRSITPDWMYTCPVSG